MLVLMKLEKKTNRNKLLIGLDGDDKMEELKYKKKKVEIELCQYDMVVVFNLAEKLLPKKRRFLDKVLRKLPSRVIDIN